MVLVTVSFDTQRTLPDDIRDLLKGGQVLHTAGVLNTRWEDYSALHIAEQAGLHAVAWDYTGDDTPATLELTAWYPHLNKAQVSARLQEMSGIEALEINGDLWYDIYRGVPFNSE